MKHLFPKITCIMTVHMKKTIEDALVTLIKQTRLTDVQILVIDSGAWATDIEMQDETAQAMAMAYARYSQHPNIEWLFTGEGRDMGKNTCMVAKVFNECFRQGLVKGDFVMTFYDDDLLHPQYIEKMAGYLEANPECDAVRCSERWVNLKSDGTREPVKVLRADRVLYPTSQYDKVVDGMQVMYTKRAVERLVHQPKFLLDKESGNVRPLESLPNWQILPESPDTCSHSDGMFFEKLAGVIKQMDYIDEVLCTHQFSGQSTFTKEYKG